MAKSKFRKPIPASQPVAEARIKVFAYQKFEQWLSGRQRLVMSVLFSMALLFRIIYFVQLNSGPCIWQHRFKETDMHFYDEWAKFIAHGDWLSNRSFHQYDLSHQSIADYYFKTHPNEAVLLQKQLGNNKSPEALGRLLWQRWDGGKMFHQDPLYIYFIAVVYKIFGEDVRYVFIFQMMAGIFSTLLIYLISRKYFGNTAALFSGLFASLCGPMLFYELVLVRESFIIFAGLLLVYLLTNSHQSKSPGKIFFFGIILALCILLKSVFVLFLFLTIGISFFVFRKEPIHFLRYSGILLGGALLAYSPLLIRNAIVGVPLFTQNSIGSIAVIASNDVKYDPASSYALNVKNTTEIIDKTGGKTLPSLIDAIQTHPSIMSYVTLLAKKLALVFHWYEFPNNKNFYYYRIHAPVLNYTFVNLIFIAPLAFIGIILSIMQRRKLWALYLLLCMHLFLLVAFLVLSRYRIPFEAALIPFSGFAIAELIKNIQIKIQLALIMLGGIIILAFAVGRPLPQSITFIRGVDYQQPFNFYYGPMIDKEIAKDDNEAAMKIMKKFMELEPDDVREMNATSPKLNDYQLVLARVYQDFHFKYSKLSERAGDIQTAKNEDARATELQEIVVLNDNTGSIESALKKAQLAPPGTKEILYRNQVAPLLNEIKLNPNNTKPYRALNEVFINLNIPDSSIYVLQQLLKLNSDNFYAVFQLGTVYGKYKNDLNNSALYLEKAFAMEPRNEDVCINLGIVYSMMQQTAKAEKMMQTVREINPNNRSNLANLELLLRNSGRTKEADEIKKQLQQ
ncbi:MAG: glycosyltransferase family 39 protein [Bacteroidetes bacterium]|nr:glycosyltransferase family 39 protein [Bacteroidota bacterium]